MSPPTNKKGGMDEPNITLHGEIVDDITTRNPEYNYIRYYKMLDITITNKHIQLNMT
jgi:hypothetical protein